MDQLANIQDYARQAAQAVTKFRSGTNPHWNDSYLNMGAQLMSSLMANDQQLALWNLNNEYNSPVEQMKRFKEAGLNPMLAYTQGTPGNSSSPAGYTAPNYDLHPHKDFLTQVQSANEIIGMISNMANNVAGIIDAGLGIQLKKNEVVDSNFNRSLMNYAFPYEPGNTPRLNYANGNIQNILNPMSDKFDPMAFLAFQKRGQLPGFLNTWYTSDLQRLGLIESNALTKYKKEYQAWYNEHLAPLFERYQEGKATSAEVQAALDQYNQTAVEMLPPELRGILQPIVDFLGPFFKFIFKSSKFTRR